MSISKFVEGFNQSLANQIAKAQKEVDENPYPLEELKKIKDTAPDSPIALRYGENGVINNEAALIGPANEQDPDLVKRLDKGEKKLDKLESIQKKQQTLNPEILITELYANATKLIAQTSSLGSKMTIKELVDLSPSEFEETYNAIFSENDELDLPINVDKELILDAFKELYGKNKEQGTEDKKAESSPINEDTSEKKAESSQSPIEEPKTPAESQTAVTGTTAVTNTPAEMPAAEVKEEAPEKQTVVNVNLEQTQEKPKVEETQQSPINAPVGETKTAETTNTEETKEKPAFVPQDANKLLYSKDSEFFVSSKSSINESEIKNAYGVSEAPAVSTAINESSTSNSQNSSQVNVENSENSLNEQTIQNNSESNSVNTTNSNQSSESNGLFSTSYLDYITQQVGSDNSVSTDYASNYLLNVSKNKPEIPRQEASFASSENKTEVSISQPEQSSTQTQGTTESVQNQPEKAENAPTSSTSQETPKSEEAPKSTSGGGVGSDSEVLDRLARIERALSTPLQVRVIS